jgi:hypothetical protein
VKSMRIEVVMLDADDQPVEHGTCRAEWGGGKWEFSEFRSTARPDEDWLLPPLYSFRAAVPDLSVVPEPPGAPPEGWIGPWPIPEDYLDPSQPWPPPRRRRSVRQWLRDLWADVTYRPPR